MKPPLRANADAPTARLDSGPTHLLHVGDEH